MIFFKEMEPFHAGPLTKDETFLPEIIISMHKLEKNAHT